MRAAICRGLAIGLVGLVSLPVHSHTEHGRSLEADNLSPRKSRGESRD
jgi:hypothetical protein